MAKTRKRHQSPPSSILPVDKEESNTREESNTKERIQNQLDNIRARTVSNHKVSKRGTRHKRDKEKASQIRDKVETKALKAINRHEIQKTRKQVWE